MLSWAELVCRLADVFSVVCMCMVFNVQLICNTCNFVFCEISSEKLVLFCVGDNDLKLLTIPCFIVRPKRTLYSKKYGVDLIRYTHAANTVVYSSNKIDGMSFLTF